MGFLRLLTPLALLGALVPSVASAESDTSCEHQTDPGPPTVHPSTLPLVRDGWIAIDRWHEISNVQLHDADGAEIPLRQVFGPETFRWFDLLQPSGLLEPGTYELTLTDEVFCFGPREVSISLEVPDELAEPIAVAPVIDLLEVTLYDGVSLSIDVELGPAPPEAGQGWVLIDADHARADDVFGKHLIAPDSPNRRASLDRSVDGDIDEVCVQATFFDQAGNPSPTTELCTMDIERVDLQSGPFGCSVGGKSSTTAMGLAMLLGLLGLRRRRR